MIEFALPSLGADMDEGTLLSWEVQPGDAVSKGQVIAVVDTAKAAIDVECWHDGVVHTLVAEVGSKMAVGTLMAVLQEPGESAAAVTRKLETARAATAVPVPARPEPAPPSGDEPVTARLRISPAARRRAEALGIDVRTLRGSAPGAALTLSDVEAAAAQPAALQLAPTRAGEMRRVIAAAMARSKREIPHYYLSEDMAFGAATEWLAARNLDLPVTGRLLAAAVLLKAVAQALQRYPEFNGFWRDGGFVAARGVHIGVAVSLRDGGLAAPALHDVDQLDIAALTRALLDLVKRTRAGSLRSSELADPSITVTNLGDQGVTSVFGVIYPPQVALIGFGRIGSRPWVDAEGRLRALPAVTASLAADHRASDGHRGARLLAGIHELLQTPTALDAAT